MFNNLAKIYKPQPSNGLSVVDLFCGCGGLALGFKRAGFDIVAGLDFDKNAIVTFNKNIGNGFVEDLSDERWKENLKSNISKSKIDVLIGGPPCQGFSLTGTRKFDDERNKLYNSIFDGVKTLNPDAVLIENVKGMATLYKGKAKEEIIRKFRELKYNVNVKILDSANYFVPQHRLRLFFVATKPNIKFRWPDETNGEGKYVNCEEGIGDLPSMKNLLDQSEADYLFDPANVFQKIMRANSERALNHQPTAHKQFVIDTIRQVPEGGNYKNLPPGVGETRKFNEAWTRYHSKRPSRTIDTGHRNHFHYKYDRVPTIRENARLQSFPDDFIFVGSKSEQNRQVGNAVPVFLAQSLGHSIAEALEK